MAVLRAGRAIGVHRWPSGEKAATESNVFAGCPIATIPLGPAAIATSSGAWRRPHRAQARAVKLGPSNAVRGAPDARLAERDEPISEPGNELRAHHRRPVVAGTRPLDEVPVQPVGRLEETRLDAAAVAVDRSDPHEAAVPPGHVVDRDRGPKLAGIDRRLIRERDDRMGPRQGGPRGRDRCRPDRRLGCRRCGGFGGRFDGRGRCGRRICARRRCARRGLRGGRWAGLRALTRSARAWTGGHRGTDALVRDETEGQGQHGNGPDGGGCEADRRREPAAAADGRLNRGLGDAVAKGRRRLSCDLAEDDLQVPLEALVAHGLVPDASRAAAS